MKEKIIIFDTTLRDGEQSLQSSLNTQEKIEIALALEEMNIDIIEAGFPISSPGDFKSVQEICKKIKNSTVCSLARCIDKDIKIAAKAMSQLNHFRIHLFLGTSKLHIESKLKKNFTEIQDMAIRSIKLAKKYTDDIEFSCEDAGRTSIDNLCSIVEILIKNGVKTINIPDTVGYTIPNEFSKIISELFIRVPNIDQAIISVHCHNDLGMAVGNSISAIQSGARQIEGTITGIGERAGNTALEELIMAIKTRKKMLNFFTDIKHQKIYKTSKIISKICYISIPINKANIGANAFAHSSGFPQDGIIKNRKNYEIFSPKSLDNQNKFNFTSRSGRTAVKNRMPEMGYTEKDYNLKKLYKKFLELADKKGQILDYDLQTLAFIKNHSKKTLNLILKNIFFHLNLQIKQIFTLNYGVKIYFIKLKFIPKMEYFRGYINLYKKLLKLIFYLKKFKIKSIHKKKKIWGKVYIIAKYQNETFYGKNTSQDIVTAIIQSMINILNNILQYKKIKKKNQKSLIKNLLR
uniref:2-isopropylmalate synthase n=1 Tax=Buchnera aphidicola (Chaitophorus populeti) TaxID=255719 RepID=Q6UA36_9GAMM|nr:2-isopropylmalate synthase [Buchnera aphidicola (Chaitophorus populeti)]